MRGLLVAALVSALAGCDRAEESPKAEKAEPAAARYASRIKQVEGSGTEYRLSRQEGEQHLRGLIDESKYEDLWIFCSPKRWVDVGRYEAVASSQSDDELIARLMAEEKELHVYHYHKSGVGVPAGDLPAYKKLKEDATKAGRKMTFSVIGREGVWTIGGWTDPHPELADNVFYPMTLNEKARPVIEKYLVDGKIDTNRIDGIISEMKEKLGITLSFRKWGD